MNELQKNIILLRAIVAKVARFETFEDGLAGEICVGGLRYFCGIGSDGVPIVNDAAISAIEKALKP